jgi:Ribosome inactivating protein
MYVVLCQNAAARWEVTRMNQLIRVTLGPTYSPDMWDLRKHVAACRKTGTPLVFVSLQAPINSETVGLAIESGSLYLIGIRGGSGPWLEFAPDDERAHPACAPRGARLPATRFIKAGDANALSTYRALRLPRMIAAAPAGVVYAGMPMDLMRFFRGWDGAIRGHDDRIAICMLIFLVCESLRFRSIETICARYIRPIGGMPADPVARPIFTFTAEMLETVQNWRDKAGKDDPDIQTWLPEMPDLITPGG